MSEALQVVGSTGTGLDQVVDIIQADYGLQWRISGEDIRGGASAADAINQLIVQAIQEQGLVNDGELSVNDVYDVSAWIRSDAQRLEDFLILHGNDENGVETGYHLVQNDGALTRMFAENAINTVFDGVYHIGFETSGDRFINEDGDRNARVESVAFWLSELLEDDIADAAAGQGALYNADVVAMTGTTGTGLDSAIDIILNDPELQRRLPGEELREGAAAADMINTMIVSGIQALGVADDGDLSAADVWAVSDWIRGNATLEEMFIEAHGNDEDGVETGFHLVQNDGAVTRLLGQNAVNTVLDGIYHIGFDVANGRLLNEDGNANARLEQVAFWLEDFLGDDLEAAAQGQGSLYSGLPEISGNTGTGLDAFIDMIVDDAGLQRRLTLTEIADGAQAANGMNHMLIAGIQATGVANDGSLNAADLRAVSDWVRADEARYEQFAAWHGNDENGVETGFHIVQGDGGDTYLFGQRAIDTVMDGIYHYGFEPRWDRFANEDGNGNVRMIEAAGWLNTILADDLAAGTLANDAAPLADVAYSGTGLDTLLDVILGDQTLQTRISSVEIHEGAAAAAGLNSLLLEGIRATGIAVDGELSAMDIADLDAWMRADADRYEQFVTWHGNDEDGVETGYHLVQGDGAQTLMFGQNAVNTIGDGIYHIGFGTSWGRLLNEDGNGNARLSDVAEWMNTLLADDLADGSLADAPATIDLEALRSEADFRADGPQQAGVEGRDAGAQTIIGDDGDNVLQGGMGGDALQGGYGNDHLQGGAGRDLLNGGRGADLLEGGAGDDLLVSASDAGEQRIGQLVLGAPTRGDANGEVNYTDDIYKLIGYEDQPLIADDVLVGGEGADIFHFRPLLNAKAEIIQKHTRDDGSINWRGVAGENNALHDHWVDGFGIDVIADYEAGVDQIQIHGHTAHLQPIEYRDVDGDGDEESILTVTSMQHGNGGAHDKDLLGQIIVHGDRVEAADVDVQSGVYYGIIDHIDDLAEAVDPQGPTKTSNYDTRDQAGNPVTGAPEDNIDNSFLAGVDTMNPGDGPTADQAPRAAGTVAFTFRADAPQEGVQYLFNAKAQDDTGALTIYTYYGRLTAAFKTESGDVHYLNINEQWLEAGEAYDVAATFGDGELALWLNGEKVDVRYDIEGFSIPGDVEDIRWGAHTWRDAEWRVNLLEDRDVQYGEFQGTLENVAVFDRLLDRDEVIALNVNGAVPVLEVAGPAAAGDLPADGATGLTGEIYLSDSNFANVSVAMGYIAANAATHAFDAARVEFGNHSDDNNVAGFLGDAATLTAGDGASEMNKIAFHVTGYMHIPAGEHTLSVASDDGYLMKIGGEIFSSHQAPRGFSSTDRTADFEGGLYEVEIFYYENGGGEGLQLSMDGAIVGDDAFFASPADYAAALATHGAAVVVDAPDGGPEVSVQGDAATPDFPGSGLTGELFNHDANFENIEALRAHIAANAATHTFDAARVDFGGVAGQRGSIEEFLAGAAALTSGDGAVAMEQVGARLTGYVVIPEGMHTLNVVSDDGVSVTVGGEVLLEHSRGRAMAATQTAADFEGGLYEIEIVYYENASHEGLRLELNGETLGAEHFYQSVADYQAALGGTAPTPVTPDVLQDVAGTTGTGLDAAVELIMNDGGLENRLFHHEIVGGAQAADGINALIVQAIQEMGLVNDGVLTAADVFDISDWIRADADRLARFIELHGDDENGVETGYHLVQGDGGVARLFANDAMNTILDGIYHIGFGTIGDRFANEDGNRNARVEDVAVWLADFLEGDIAAAAQGAGPLYRDFGAGEDVLVGDAENNMLVGAEGADTLYGGAGDDNLTGGAAGDVLNGGEGFDFAQYLSALSGVTVNLGDAGANTGEAAGDVYISVEGVIGSTFDDVLTGDAANNVLQGGAGADALDGGSGSDAASYEDALAGVRADLKNAAANRGEAAGDAYVSIENLIGSTFGDELRGNGGRNQIDGGDGDDVMRGRGGNDTMLGGDGDDEMRGDGGRDLMDGGDGDDALIGGGGGDEMYGGEGDDTLAGGGGGDDMFGGLGDDTLSGNGGADDMFGDDGDDTLTGGGGADTLNGGEGDDTLVGNGGSDVLNGGVGDDILTSGGGSDTFVFAAGDGADVITDFRDGRDTLAFSADFSFADLAISDVDGDARIDYGADSVVLTGVDVADLDAADFTFG